MPFDGRDWEPMPPPPPRSAKPDRAERALLWLIFALAIVLTVLPISADGMIDLARYLFG